MIWHNPVTNPPWPLVDVLLAVRGETPSAEGWRDPEGNYTYSTGHPIAAGAVYAWTELPRCPEIDAVPQLTAPAAAQEGAS